MGQAVRVGNKSYTMNHRSLTMNYLWKNEKKNIGFKKTLKIVQVLVPWISPPEGGGAFGYWLFNIDYLIFQ